MRVPEHCPVVSGRSKAGAWGADRCDRGSAGTRGLGAAWPSRVRLVSVRRVRYEVALEEMLGLLAAACTDQIAREQSKPSPEATVIEDWRRRRAATSGSLACSRSPP